MRGVLRLPYAATIKSPTFPFDRMEAIRDGEPLDPVEGQAMVSWVCIVWFALGVIPVRLVLHFALLTAGNRRDRS